MPDTRYALVYDDGNHEDIFDAYPPDDEIADARRAAPKSWTQVDQLVSGWDYQTVAEYPPLAAPVTEDGEQDAA